MSQINVIRNFNQKLLDELMKDETFQRIRGCIQCGECYASCPSGRYTALKTRQVIRKVLMGNSGVLTEPDIWYCTTCFNCYERCPRHIPVTEVIIKLRNVAVRDGNLMNLLKSAIKLLVEYGHAVPIGGADSKWAQYRAFMGLDQLPPTVHAHQNALQEMQKLLYLIKFKERIPYQK